MKGLENSLILEKSISETNSMTSPRDACLKYCLQNIRLETSGLIYLKIEFVIK